MAAILRKALGLDENKQPTFPSPFKQLDYQDGAPPKCLRELRMMQLSASIREKPDWERKKDDPAIVAKWRQEATAPQPDDAANPGRVVTPEMFDYVLAELDYYKQRMDGPMQIAGVDGVWRADHLVEDSLREELRKQVKKLESVPDDLKDWHPGSDKKVLDLVHPSLFCLVYGVTRVVPESDIGKPPLSLMGSGQIIQPPIAAAPIKKGRMPRNLNEDPSGRDFGVSKKFQWLPSEFSVSPSGQVSIDSYINNLHPVYQSDCATVIGRVFERFVPMFNKVLTDVFNPRPDRIDVDTAWYGDEPDFGSDYDAADEWQEQRVPKQPDIPEFEPVPAPKMMITLQGKKLQVIVKIAEIILTPESPDYKGGSWHVEGMKNESIVATGIYYFDVDNISESRLQFRQAVGEPNYEQNDRNGVRLVYGLEDESALNQEFGSVVTCGDRCICFPNTYQHRVAPFSLIDKQRPGVRKILVFFLVDPAVRIVSTATVPPQQRAYMPEHLQAMYPFNTIVPDLLNIVLDYVDFPMSMDEAKRHREKLMEERKFFVTEVNETAFERPFSLCEH